MLLCSFLVSCNKVVKEYYPDGKIKKSYETSGGVKHGYYREYFPNENVKLIQIYKNGELQDSSVYYTKDNSIDFIDYHKNSQVNSRKYFYTNGQVKMEGPLDKSLEPKDIWKFYDQQGSLYEMQQYKLINGKRVLNQNWFVNGLDTLKGKGSHYTLILEKDTINLEEPVKAKIDLIEPVFKDKNSSIKVILTKDYSIDFNEDFSNINEVVMDTTENLNLEEDYRKALGITSDFRKTAIFGRYFDKAGPIKLRGILVEYYYDNLDDDVNKPNYFENKKYFEKEIFVKSSDTLE